MGTKSSTKNIYNSYKSFYNKSNEENINYDAIDTYYYNGNDNNIINPKEKRGSINNNKSLSYSSDSTNRGRERHYNNYYFNNEYPRDNENVNNPNIYLGDNQNFYSEESVEEIPKPSKRFSICLVGDDNKNSVKPRLSQKSESNATENIININNINQSRNDNNRDTQILSKSNSDSSFNEYYGRKTSKSLLNKKQNNHFGYQNSKVTKPLSLSSPIKHKNNKHSFYNNEYIKTNSYYDNNDDENKNSNNHYNKKSYRLSFNSVNNDSDDTFSNDSHITSNGISVNGDVYMKNRYNNRSNDYLNSKLFLSERNKVSSSSSKIDYSSNKHVNKHYMKRNKLSSNIKDYSGDDSDNDIKKNYRYSKVSSSLYPISSSEDSDSSVSTIDSTNSEYSGFSESESLIRLENILNVKLPRLQNFKELKLKYGIDSKSDKNDKENHPFSLSNRIIETDDSTLNSNHSNNYSYHHKKYYYDSSSNSDSKVTEDSKKDNINKNSNINQLSQRKDDDISIKSSGNNNKHFQSQEYFDNILNELQNYECLDNFEKNDDSISLDVAINHKNKRRSHNKDKNKKSSINSDKEVNNVIELIKIPKSESSSRSSVSNVSIVKEKQAISPETLDIISSYTRSSDSKESKISRYNIINRKSGYYISSDNEFFISPYDKNKSNNKKVIDRKFYKMLKKYLKLKDLRKRDIVMIIINDKILESTTGYTSSIFSTSVTSSLSSSTLTSTSTSSSASSSTSEIETKHKKRNHYYQKKKRYNDYNKNKCHRTPRKSKSGNKESKKEYRRRSKDKSLSDSTIKAVNKNALRSDNIKENESQPSSVIIYDSLSDSSSGNISNIENQNFKSELINNELPKIVIEEAPNTVEENIIRPLNRNSPRGLFINNKPQIFIEKYSKSIDEEKDSEDDSFSNSPVEVKSREIGNISEVIPPNQEKMNTYIEKKTVEEIPSIDENENENKNEQELENEHKHEDENEYENEYENEDENEDENENENEHEDENEYKNENESYLVKETINHDSSISLENDFSSKLEDLGLDHDHLLSLSSSLNDKSNPNIIDSNIIPNSNANSNDNNVFNINRSIININNDVDNNNKLRRSIDENLSSSSLKDINGPVISIPTSTDIIFDEDNNYLTNEIITESDSINMSRSTLLDFDSNIPKEIHYIEEESNPKVFVSSFIENFKNTSNKNEPKSSTDSTETTKVNSISSEANFNINYNILNKLNPIDENPQKTESSPSNNIIERSPLLNTNKDALYDNDTKNSVIDPKKFFRKGDEGDAINDSLDASIISPSSAPQKESIININNNENKESNNELINSPMSLASTPLLTTVPSAISSSSILNQYQSFIQPQLQPQLQLQIQSPIELQPKPQFQLSSLQSPFITPLFSPSSLTSNQSFSSINSNSTSKTNLHHKNSHRKIDISQFISSIRNREENLKAKENEFLKVIDKETENNRLQKNMIQKTSNELNDKINEVRQLAREVSNHKKILLEQKEANDELQEELEEEKRNTLDLQQQLNDQYELNSKQEQELSYYKEIHNMYLEENQRLQSLLLKLTNSRSLNPNSISPSIPSINLPSPPSPSPNSSFCSSPKNSLILPISSSENTPP